MAKAYFIEHGQTDFDKEHKVHGHIDEPLNDEGRKQARALAEKIAQMPNPPTHLYASPKRRAAETAKILHKYTGIPLTVTPKLKPLDVGDFSGKNEVKTAEALKPYFAHQDRVIPGGQSVGDWKKNHLGFEQRIIDNLKPGERPGFVTHSNVIGSSIAYAKGGEDGRHAMAKPPKNGTIMGVDFPAGRRR